jgi:endonuclease/exonuclease/phosphatase family metal-dependent hydrolase
MVKGGVTTSLLLMALVATGCATASDADTDGQEEEVAAVAPEAATAASSLRIMTYNIKNGELVGHDLSKLAAVIKESNPDIIGLQEVDEVTHRSQGKHETDELSTLTGMPYKYFAANFPFDGGQYGLAILSKYPITASTTVRLDDHTDRANGYEPRIAAVADIEAKGETVTFVTVHASLHSEERPGNAKAILNALGARASRAIIVGDFNEKPSQAIGDALTGAGFVDSFHEKHSLFGYTEPANIPMSRIDFIYRANGMGKTEHAWVPDTQASDHRPVGAVIPLH